MATLAAAVGLMVSLPSVAGTPEQVDIVAIHARQDGSERERFECHAACGATVIGATQEAHCENSTWREQFDECLSCAGHFEIWRYYEEGVSVAGEACGVETTTTVVETVKPGEDKDHDGGCDGGNGDGGNGDGGNGDDCSAASHLMSSSGVVLFAMLAAAGML
ncbi:hypothetical protein ACRALDRAFT_1072910 [Sodiomyces alcalophilus JCM 7366]|uniref:uncharacterized protein n=1 Tax=Sodiomyces alcalophilus JCM 7366 TaxID=591952 RepID=UPI0039B511E9